MAVYCPYGHTALRSPNLIQLLEPHQHIPRLAAVGGAEDPRQLELVDDPRRASVADAHAPLQQGGRSQLVLDADLGGLPEQRVALAGPPRAFPTGLAGFRRLQPLDLGPDPGLRLLERFPRGLGAVRPQ